MADKLRWMVELIDKMSGPAKQAGSGLSSLHGKLNDLQEQAGFTSITFTDVASKVALAGTAFLTAAGYAGYAFAKMGVDALSFKENTLTSFKLMLGSQQAADQVFKQAVQMAKLTPWETTDVVGGFKALLSAGFSKEDVGTVFSALSDVAAASGFDKAVINSLAIQMAQVKAYGKLQMVDLRVMANQMAQAGVGIGAVYEKIAKNMGIGAEQVHDAMGKGMVSADVGILSIMQAIQEKASGGQALGSLTQQMGQTISGLFSTISSAGADFFLTLESKLEDMPGLKAFKGFLINLRDLLDTNTQSGKHFQSVVEKVFNGNMAGLFERFAGSGGMGRLLEVMEGIVNVALVAWDAFKAFAGGIYDAVKPMIDLAGGMGTADASSQGLAQTFRLIGLTIGFIIDGVVTLTMAFGWLASKLDTVSKAFHHVSCGREPSGIDDERRFDVGVCHDTKDAPSAFMKRVEDLQKSKAAIDSGALPDVAAKLAATAPAANSDAFSPGPSASMSEMQGAGDVSGATAGRGVAVNLTIQVDNTGHHDGDAIAARLGELLPTQLAAVFDQLATSMGVG
jgi:tape measure domain-containing protein